METVTSRDTGGAPVDSVGGVGVVGASLSGGTVATSFDSSSDVEIRNGVSKGLSAPSRTSTEGRIDGDGIGRL